MFINIEIERLRNYMSMKVLATRMGVPASTIDDWIHKRQPIPAEKLRALSRLFSCSLDYLLKEGR